ncbi:MAG: response regulator, partial [Pseudomonadales bacterium]|nr:response regulator [Pseudomonadales bacterium]
VDDEEMILDVGAAMLSRLGYQVLIARNGEEAMNLFEKQRQRIDLVVLDMIMPGWSGGELYEKMSAVDPDVKVLLSSGYSLNEEARAIMAKGVNGFIQKPYTLASLSSRLDEVLGRTGAVNNV